jgi:cytoskeleton protein RodZ
MSAETAGSALAAARSARGLSLDRVAAATRIRRPYLEALESWRLGELPGAVYARGYLRAYAEHLELDATPLLAQLPEAAPGRSGSLSLRRLAPRLPADLALTSPLLAGIGLVTLALLFGAYAWRQFESVRPATPVAATQQSAAVPIASPPAEAATPAPASAQAAAPAGAGHVVILALSVKEQAWVAVSVDGRPAFGPNGRFFDPGEVAVFAGRSISVSSGKGASTLVTVDGRDLGSLGAGVVTREFKAEN